MTDTPGGRRVAPTGFRLTEMLAAVALATDLGTGQPAAHSLRTCLLSVGLARDLGMDADTVRAVHHVALLRFLGCTADAAETAVMTGGEDATFLAAMAPVFMGSGTEAMQRLIRTLGAGHPPARRLRVLAGALSDPGYAQRSLSAHCEVAARLADRLGMGERVREALAHAYERWDGKGVPEGLAGEAVPIEIRVATVARDAELWWRAGGHDAVRDVLRRRRGHGYDPAVVDGFLDGAEARMTALDGLDLWRAVLDAEPEPHRQVTDAALDEALAAFGDFADLKSPWMRGHSARVAELGEAAGKACDLPAEDVTLLRRAGWVHDVGRVAVSAGVWDAPRPLSVGAQEQVRLHPYHSERVLARCRALRREAALAGAHHERLDGSGYYRGSRAADLPVVARLLAAADVWAALTADRPQRAAVPVADAVPMLRAERGLDAGAVDAVLAAAGLRPAHRPTRWPAGLTDREVDVLRLIARGRSNREVARALVLSPKTVGRHIENVYGKIGVRTRAAAALFAMEQRLLP